MMMLKLFIKSSWATPIICDVNAICAVDETGKYSVTPSTIPKIVASYRVMSILV